MVDNEQVRSGVERLDSSLMPASFPDKLKLYFLRSNTDLRDAKSIAQQALQDATQALADAKEAKLLAQAAQELAQDAYDEARNALDRANVAKEIADEAIDQVAIERTRNDTQDQEIAQLQQDVQSGSQDVTELQNQVDQNTTDIGNLNTGLTSLGNNVTDLRTTVASQGNTIASQGQTLANLGQTVSNQGTAIADIDQHTIKNNVTALQNMGGPLNMATELRINSTKVVGTRQTGWTASSGTALKGAFAADQGYNVSLSYTATDIRAIADGLIQARQRIKALEDVHRAHGLSD